MSSSFDLALAQLFARSCALGSAVFDPTALSANPDTHRNPEKPENRIVCMTFLIESFLQKESQPLE
jgi:hypothetical protein